MKNYSVYIEFSKKILVIFTLAKCGTQMNSLYIFIINNDFFHVYYSGKQWSIYLSCHTHGASN